MLSTNITITGQSTCKITMPQTLRALVLLANAYGTQVGRDPPGTGLHQWNPNADINGDGKVNLSDLVILSNHYRQHYP
jgi:hypothetical protein